MVKIFVVAFIPSADESLEGNKGWADAMAKILGKHLPSDKVCEKRKSTNMIMLLLDDALSNQQNKCDSGSNQGFLETPVALTSGI